MPSRWTPPEIELLDLLAGNVPYGALPRAYNTRARKDGHPQRTAKAIRLKAQNLGISAYPAGDWITIAAIVDALHVCGFTVRRWISLYGLPASKDGNMFVVRRRDLRVFARGHQRLFSRATRAELARLLGDEALADEIISGRHVYATVTHPVRCVETGKVYPSLATAARAHYVVRQVIQKAIRNGCRAGGRHWEWAEPYRSGSEPV